MTNRPRWLVICLDTLAAAALLCGLGMLLPRSMRNGADVSVCLLLVAAIALWSGVRAASVRELCVRGAGFCGLLATVPAVGLVIARLRDTGHISRRVVAGILTIYILGFVSCIVFILLGLISRTLRRQ